MMVNCYKGYSGTDTTRCQPNGTFSVVQCVECVLGKYNDAPDQSTCKDDCGAGFYIVEDRTSCKTCPYGQWQDQDDQSSCKKCAAGKILKEGGQRSNGCTDCIAGQYNPNVGHDYSCFPCPTADSGASECNVCVPGMYINTSIISDVVVVKCSTCQLGNYTDTIDLSSCKICPKGYYTNDQTKQEEAVVRRHRCQECGRGKYGDIQGQTTSEGCKDCDAGRYSDIEGLAKEKTDDVICTACVLGTYSSEEGNAKDSKCLSCDPGKYGRDSPGATNKALCLECIDGKYSDEIGASGTKTCQSCEVGQLSNKQKTGTYF